MLCKDELLEISDKFNGLILRKAESSRNFESTYAKAFISLQRIESIDDIRVFEILGEFGG
jgi:hypothetical protein